MLNFGWAELLVIGLVALIVIGPEDLPDMFRQMGRFTAKLRSMSREFSRAMEQAAKESGVKDAADDLKSATSAKSLGLEAVKSAADKFEKWDPIKNAAKPTTAMPARSLVPPAMPATSEPALAADEAAGDLAAAEMNIAPPPPMSAPIAPPMMPQASPIVTLPPEMGPATQALYDKQALRAKVLAEQSAKLKAIEDGTYQAEPTILPPAEKPRAAKARPAGAVAEAVTKPKKSSKKAEQV